MNEPQAQPTALRERMTLQEIADFERVHVQSVRRWVRGGLLRGIRQGRQVVVPRAELLEFERRRFG